MKRFLLLLPLLGALPAVAAEPLNYNVVSFSERADTTVAHDLMTVMLAVQEEGADRQAVNNALTRRLNIVQAKIAEYPAFQAELRNRNTQPRYEKGRIAGWSDTAYLQVKSKDFQALNKLLAAVQSRAVLQHLFFSVSPEKRSETVNELSRQALKNFRTRADMVSRTLGFSAYRIVNIDMNGSFSTHGQAKMMRTAVPLAMAAYDSAVEMAAEHPGSEAISQTVSGSIQMH